MTWDHPRGIDPLAAVSAEYSSCHPEVSIVWEARPLSSFEDTPLGELASDYDLIAIDHPFLGDAVRDRVLSALDELIDADGLARRADDSVGPSHESYHWQGKQWALAIDAACQVSALRPHDIAAAPSHWPDALELARDLGRERVVIAANPTHLWCTFLTLCETVSEPGLARFDGTRPGWWPDTGIDSSVAVAALQLLSELLSVCSPRSFRLNPIDVLDEIAEGGGGRRAAYAPLVFGYVTYARAPGDAVVFAPAPRLAGGNRGSLAGGVGLAISAKSSQKDSAAGFLRYATSGGVQRGSFANAGGQPARRSAWLDESVNTGAHDFFRAGFPTMQSAFLRPRYAGMPAFQIAAAAALHHLMTACAPYREIADVITGLWERHVFTG